jgi:hypothetical protein
MAAKPTSEPVPYKLRKVSPQDDETVLQGKPYKLSPMAIATWTRLQSAGEAPIAGKPYKEERADVGDRNAKGAKVLKSKK